MDCYSKVVTFCAVCLISNVWMMDLVPLSEIPIGSCGNLSLGILDNGLEDCNQWILASTSANQAYEVYKCKKLRVHASVKNGKCVCDENWKGPICNEISSPCTEDEVRCKPFRCPNNGTLGVGKDGIGCI